MTPTVSAFGRQAEACFGLRRIEYSIVLLQVDAVIKHRHFGGGYALLQQVRLDSVRHRHQVMRPLEPRFAIGGMNVRYNRHSRISDRPYCRSNWQS
jgi:hypothetical protein